MFVRIASLVVVCTLLAAVGRPAVAGGIHIRYGPDAPEKLAAKNLGYYEGIVTMEHRHPAAFAEEHPFYARMFHDPGLLNKEMALWEAHEQRFEYWHWCLWKFLDGYRASHDGPFVSHTFPTASSLSSLEGHSGIAGLGGGGVGSNSGGLDWLGSNPGHDQGVLGGGVLGGGGLGGGVLGGGGLGGGGLGGGGLGSDSGGGGGGGGNGGGGGGGNGGGGNGGGGGGGGIGIQSVPEPSSGLLLMVGLAVAAGWTAARRLRARAARALPNAGAC